MHLKVPAFYLIMLVFFSFYSCRTGPDVETEVVEEVEILPPTELYGTLFTDVQTRAIFEDSKTFVDAIPEYDVSIIRQRYEMLDDTTAEGIETFVREHFEIPSNASKFKTDSLSIRSHITKLWDILGRPADEIESGTLIPLPNAYIVPGGRFREIYYWDSYFTMLGLQADGQTEVIQNMVNNFAFLIERYGFIPNGNRTYYLGRSQPPFFALMVQILAEEKGDQVYAKYLPYLKREYEFWMKGAASVQSGSAVNRVVKLEGGTILNRYWDNLNTPRPESYREDVKTAEMAVQSNPNLTKEEVYRNLRAGAESGWDFSSRWLDENSNFDLSTIHTTQILPVDLNSLLYNLESTIAKASDLSNDTEAAKNFRSKAESRKKAILKYFWSSADQFFMDYNFQKNQVTNRLSLAAVYPLFFKIASDEQANLVAVTLKSQFLKPGGLITTPYNTGQQWDAPNGWAPLQYLAIKGLQNYSIAELSNEIRDRWVKLNSDVYSRTFKMTEKYNVEDLSKESGGGEYPTQDGFGWTNGVYQKLTAEK